MYNLFTIELCLIQRVTGCCADKRKQRCFGHVRVAGQQTTRCGVQGRHDQAVGPHHIPVWNDVEVRLCMHAGPLFYLIELQRLHVHTLTHMSVVSVGIEAV